MKTWYISARMRGGIWFVALFGAAALMPIHAHAATIWGLTWLNITSRSEWGADEAWRYASRPEYQAAIQAAAEAEENEEEQSPSTTEIALNYIMDIFAGEFAIQRVWRSEGGNQLYRPLQIVKKKTKILVHHTASDPSTINSIDDEKAYIQDVYKYHAFSKGRGDIGYNFVIMPSGRIYEWRKWGAGVVAAHATRNNTPSVGISLVGNFVNTEPTQAQIDALTTLMTSLAVKYNINPTESAAYFRKSNNRPYIEVNNHPRIAGHTDAWYTSCPGAKLYELLPTMRQEVARRIQWLPAGRVVVPKLNLPLGGSNSPTPAGGLAPMTPRSAYCVTSSCNPSTALIQRMDEAPSVSSLATLHRAPVRVLLYEASTTREKRAVSCQGLCTLQYPWWSRRVKSVIIQKENDGFWARWVGGSAHKTKFALSAGISGSLTIVDYDRKTSNGIGLNVFRESLLFTLAPLKKIWGEVATWHQVINVVSQDHYMQGIAEASDAQSQTKADVLALLSKQYMLFYTNPLGTHPSIPAGAVYNTIDDPRLFQKYLGKWWESVSTKWPIALQHMKWKYIVYDNKLPLLPYFHCSAWFTWSAKEKRWWTDTPYLISVDDQAGNCNDGTFAWHGVGLSGKGASAMADAGKSVEEIITHYYPGVSIR